MNKVILIGRLTKDPEFRYTANTAIPVATFTLAVDRDFKDASGNKQSDFISCRAWRKTAELIANNLTKGRLIAVTGAIQTGSYTAQDGSKRYTTEVVVDHVQFLDHAKDQTGANKTTESNMSDAEFFPVEGDDDIPF